MGIIISRAFWGDTTNLRGQFVYTDVDAAVLSPPGKMTHNELLCLDILRLVANSRCPTLILMPQQMSELI